MGKRFNESYALCGFYNDPNAGAILCAIIEIIVSEYQPSTTEPRLTFREFAYRVGRALAITPLVDDLVANRREDSGPGEPKDCGLLGTVPQISDEPGCRGTETSKEQGENKEE